MADQEVVVLLTAKFAEYEKRLEKAERLSDTKFKGMATSAEQSAARMERAIRESSGKTSAVLKGLAGSLATYFSGRELMNLSDSFTRLQNNLKVSGLEGEKLAGVQSNLLDISQRYGASVESLSGVFMKASMAQKELGASTQQIVQLNEVIAAALKVTGTSAQEASGALLQLGQALSSGVVRAEEFNSLLEGAYPLVQAAARGIDRFGGSVAKLRVAVTEGKVSSREFFEGVLKGGVETIKQAESATMTLSGAFEALKSSITVYVGEADKANGVSAALAEGIGKLADNLDLVTNALAVVAAVMVGRYAGGLALGIAKTDSLGASARSAGKLLMGAFGGGVGIAVTAFVGSLGAIAIESRRTDAAMLEVYNTLNESRRALRDASTAGDDAADSTKDVGDRSSTATPKVKAFAGAVGDAADKLYKLAKARQADALAELQAKRQQASLDYSELYGKTSQGRQARADAMGPFPGLRDIGPLLGLMRDNLATWTGFAPDDDELNRQMQRLKEAMGNYDAAIEEARKNLERYAADPDGGGGSGGNGDKPKKPKGPTAQEIEARFQAELAAETQRTLSARQGLAATVEERANLERQALDTAVAQYRAEVQADKHYTAAQKAALIAAAERTAAFERERINRDEAAAIVERMIEGQRYELDALAAQSDIADTRKARLALEMRILDIIEEQERQELEASIAAGRIADANKARADLAEAQAGRRTGVGQRNESPLERRRREIEENGEALSDVIEQSAIDALDEFNDGLVDAIMKSKSLGDVFKNVAEQIIRDLIRIAVQQTIVNGLMKGLSSMFGGGVIGSSVAAFGANFAASGTNFAHGGVYRVGEAGPETVVLPRGAKVLPATQTAAMGKGQTTVTQVLQFDLKGAVLTHDLLAQMNQMAQTAAVGGAIAGSRDAQQSLTRRARNTLR